MFIYIYNNLKAIPNEPKKKLNNVQKNLLWPYKLWWRLDTEDSLLRYIRYCGSGIALTNFSDCLITESL